MSFIIQLLVRSAFQSLICGVFILTFALHAVADDSNQHFSGPYLGVSLSSQNIFAGSFVDGVDILAEEQQLVIDLTLGWRQQLPSQWLIGAELQFGKFSGDLSFEDPIRELDIRYEGNTQLSYGGIIGKTFGRERRTILYLYVLETERKFDVEVDTIFGSFQQNDKQGVMRFGLGLEHPISPKFSIKASLGRSRVDFGGLATNIDVDDETDFLFGLNYLL